MMSLCVFLGLVGAASASSNFISLGDWGDTEAQAINDTMAEYSPEFILALGDNFYSKGVDSVDDPLFTTIFEDQFSADSMQVPWYVCAGNHDYYGGKKGVAAEMEYTNRSDRWIYPELYYNKEVTGSDGTTYNIISIDTWRISGGDVYVAFDVKTGRSALKNVSKIEHEFRTGLMDKGKHDVLLKNFQPENPADPVVIRDDTDQLVWFNETLCESQADWNLIIGHFPIYSATTGEHGDTTALVSQLLPLMEGCNKGNQLYFSGHDHILQHNQKDGINMFGSGAGARTHTGVDPSHHYLMGYHQGSYGFMVHQATPTELATDFVIDDGSEPYSYTITL